MLQQEIRQEFGHLLRIIIPQDVGLTILKGTVGVMVYSHCTGPGPDMGLVMGPGSIGSNILHRNVHTGVAQGQGPGPIVPIVPVPCSVNKPLVWGHLRIINPQIVGFNTLEYVDLYTLL